MTESPDSTTGRLRAYIEGLRDREWLPPVATLADTLGDSAYRIRTGTRALEEQGLLERVGWGRYRKAPVPSASSPRGRFDWTYPHSMAEVIRTEALWPNRALRLLDAAERPSATPERHGDVFWHPDGHAFGLALSPDIIHSDTRLLLAIGARDEALERAREIIAPLMTPDGLPRPRQDRLPTERRAAISACGLRAGTARYITERDVRRLSSDWVNERCTPPAGVSRVEGLIVVTFEREALLVITGAASPADRDRARTDAQRLWRLPAEVLRHRTAGEQHD